MFLKIIKNAGLGRKLITRILLFSSLVTFLGTSLQLYFDYTHHIEEIQNTMGQIESSYLQSISSSLWYIDKEQVTISLNGILQLPDMQHLEIKQKEELYISVGQPQQDNVIQREFPLSFKFKGQDKKLGVLKATATLTGIYKQLWNRTTVILSTQAVKTFLVSAFIFYIFYSLVGRHLVFMADYARRLDLKLLKVPLNLKRKSPSNIDELETLVESINIMRKNIADDIEERKQAEKALELTNQKLEIEIRERIQAEMVLKQFREDLEKKVDQRTVQLSEANKELDTFAYSVSHDLRAPLRGIDGFSLALMEDFGDVLDDAAKDYLKRIRSGCVRMGLLIDDMLKLSRLSRGSINKESLDLSFMAKEILERLKTSQPDRNVTIDIMDDIKAMGDATLVQAVLENLLGNAWKFTSKTKNAHIIFGNEEEHDGLAKLFVKDNGAGFDMAYVNKLFSAFQRLHTPQEFEGSGIGLATVQRIVHRHGGTVSAKGEVGKGAIFYFTL